MSKLVIFLIVVYQKTISPLLRRRIQCRFYPTCSDYAILAIEKYGVTMGTRKALNRINRCRPDNFESCIDYP
ncbi:membrane protein insertion efficiency factor YidD [Candidatus Microgenomates bacterium]|nr:membrane protein insertion efficiency factor YidD [Candidatus Microgenomates bacterium]